MLNRVFLIGNLTRDPEVKYLPSGTAVTNFDIAVSERYRDRNQEQREEVLFIQIETFQRLAETCAQYLKKGRRVCVEGKLKLDTWEAKDGTKRSRIKVRGMSVTFIDSRSDSGEAPAQQAAPSAPQPQPAAPSGPPAQAAPVDVPAPPDIPEVDINDPEADAGAGQPSTNDDLPF